MISCIRWFILLFFVALILLISPHNTPVSHAAQDVEKYTYQLTESTAVYQLWTTPPSERVFKDNVLTQTSDSLGRLGDYPDPLWPLQNGDTVNLTAEENTSFWITLFVPPITPTGNYTTNVQIGGVNAPVTLHVFNFAILHVKSQMNFSHNAMLDAYSVPGTGSEYWFYVDGMKQFFIDHRLTSKSPLWPGGVTSNGGAPFIDYDCNTQTLSDPRGIWGLEQPADKYLNGNGFNDGAGFPSFMVATFQNNDASADQRPSTFTKSAYTDWNLVRVGGLRKCSPRFQSLGFRMRLPCPRSKTKR